MQDNYRLHGLWIKGSEGAFLGYRQVVLLERIRDNGSISAAARSMKMSYRHAWKLVHSMNRQSCNQVVKKSAVGVVAEGPFDAFFAADVGRPELLEQEGLASPGTRFTYAIGKVVLWSPKENGVDSEGNMINEQSFRHLAIANPKLAPYGKAAQQILLAKGAWTALRGKVVRGENIGQTFQFVKRGDAELGFVAYSQVKRPDHPIEGSWWEAPQVLYTPIEQQAVLLKENEATRAFMLFVQSDVALKIIQGYGYDTP